MIGGLQIGQVENIKKDLIEMHCDDNWIEVAVNLGTGCLWHWCCSYLSDW